MSNVMNYACEYVVRWPTNCGKTYCGRPSTWRYPDQEKGYVYFCDYHYRCHHRSNAGPLDV